MDALEHAEAILARAQQRDPTVVIPSTAGSPMDDRLTLVIPQDLIDDCEPVGILDDVALAELDRAAAAERALAMNSGSVEQLVAYQISSTEVDAGGVVDAEMERLAKGGLGKFWNRRRAG